MQSDIVTSSMDNSTNAARGVTSSVGDSGVSTVGDWYNRAESVWNQTYNTLGYVAQDWGTKLANGRDDLRQMFDNIMGSKSIYDMVNSFTSFWSDPTSITNVGSVLNDFIGLPGVIDSQPWSTYEQDWLKAANDVLDIGLSLGEGHYWNAADTAIPNIFEAGDLMSQVYFPGAIDALSGWGVSTLDYLEINPWNLTSFDGDTDWQQGLQQLIGIAEGFFNDGFIGAARESTNPIMQWLSESETFAYDESAPDGGGFAYDTGWDDSGWLNGLDPDFFNNLGPNFSDSESFSYDESAPDGGGFAYDTGRSETGRFNGDGSRIFAPGYFDGLNFEQYSYDETPTPHYELHGFDSPSSWAASWGPIYQVGSYGFDGGSYETGYGGYDDGYGSYSNTSYPTDYSSLLPAYQDALRGYNQRFEYDY
jgi:hypothetical protein